MMDRNFGDTDVHELIGIVCQITLRCKMKDIYRLLSVERLSIMVGLRTNKQEHNPSGLRIYY